MALFQRAPSSEAEVAAAGPLATPPDQLLTLSEEEWYRSVYRGEHLAQLTVRAVLVGSALGFLLALTNVYIGLKAGWHLGVSITASILAFGSWSFLARVGVAKTRMTILETNCMQSTASAAGYATGNTVISAFPAMLMLSVSAAHPFGVHVPTWAMVGFIFLAGLLGTVLAIPMKRNLINHEKLRFPTGMASAVTLHGLYGHGAEAMRKARVLLLAGGVAMLVPLVKDLAFRVVTEGGTRVREALLPASSKIFDWLPGVTIGGKTYLLSDFTIKLDHGVALIGAGVMVGIRVTTWMVIGGLVLAFVVTPVAMTAAWTNPAGAILYAATRPGTAWKEIGLWLGAPLLVASGLVSFALGFRTIVRAMQSLTTRTGGAGGELAERIKATEVPLSWFVVGTLAAAIPLVVLAQVAFEIPIVYGLLAVAMTFVLCLVAARATGETDITPTGAMGKIMQLTYGVLIPQSTSANLMTAGITAGSAAASADLLSDLKSGYLLGAHPRRQFVAQALGVITGAVASVAGFYLLVPDTRVLTGTDGRDPTFPAPAAQQWMAVAQLFQKGLDHFHPMARSCIVAGLVLGTVLALLERFAPDRLRRFAPSATGLGLGMILPFYYPLAMFLGALVAWFADRTNREWAERNVITIAAGVIAGESIMGVLVAALNTFVFND
jgi:OPT family oligopeptide transporter